MRELIRWYKESPPRLRVVFRTRLRAAESTLDSAPAPRRERRRILVVCFGNVCRSPFAAHRLQQQLDRREWQVLSAGTDAADGKRVTEYMRVAADERGIDLSTHRSRKVTPELLRTSDLIITVSQRQAEKLWELEPAVKRRVRLLGGFHRQPNTWGLPADRRKSAAHDDYVADPSGEDFEFHRECCERLEDSVAQLSRWVLRREASRSLPRTRVPLSAPPLGAARLR